MSHSNKEQKEHRKFLHGLTSLAKSFAGCRVLRNGTAVLVLLASMAWPAAAQFTQVSGTVQDVNGLAYSCATITASIVNANGQTLYLSGQIFAPQPASTKLGCPTDPNTSRTNGAFAMQLADNTQIKCGNAAGAIVTCGVQTTWAFTVNTTGEPPPFGTGPQTCSSTQTISGGSQVVNLTSCPALTTSSSGGSGGSPVSLGLIGQYPLTDGTGTTAKDLSNSGNALTFCAGGNAPTWDTQANGYGVLFGSGANQCINLPAGMNGALTFQFFITFQSNATGNGTPTGSGATIIRLLLANSGGQSATAAEMGLVSNFNTDVWGNETAGGYRMRSLATAANNYVSSTSCAFNGNGAISFTMGAADAYYINYSPCDILQSGVSAGRQSTGNFQIGATSQSFVGKLAYMLVYSRALTASEVAQNVQFMTNAAQARNIQSFLGGDSADTNDQIISDGDSLTAGLLWPVPLLNGTWNIIDQGKGGRTAAQVTADVTTDVVPMYRNAALRNISVNWSGTNSPSPATTVTANHRSYCNTVQNLKARCVTTTMIDRSGLSLAKDQLNDAIRQNEPLFADLVCDQAANVHLGADGANANTTYFNVDGIHLTTFADTNIVGPNFVNCINRVFGNTLQNGKYNTYKGTGVQIPTVRQFTTCGGSGVTSTCTFPWPIVSGSLLFANIDCLTCSGITINSVADTLVNTWTAVSAGGVSGNAAFRAFFALNSGAGANTITITYSGSSNNVLVTVEEVTGVLTAAAQDVTSAIATGTSTSPASANVTPSTNGDLVLCYMGTTTLLNGSPWTPTAPYIQYSNHPDSFVSAQVVTTAANTPCSATLSSSQNWFAQAVAFKPGTGTSAFQVQPADIYMECDPSTANTILNLPDASWMTGYSVTIKNVQTAGANTCVAQGITPAATGVAQTIDGGTVTIANKATAVFKSKLTFTGVAGTNLSPVSNWIETQ